MAKYPKLINHFGYEVLKLGVGAYTYRGFLIERDKNDLFFFIHRFNHPRLISFGSLRQCCETIDIFHHLNVKTFKKPLPIDIVEINGVPIY